MSHCRSLPQVLLAVSCVSAAAASRHEVMVVTSTEESGVGEPKVLEIFDFQGC